MLETRVSYSYQIYSVDATAPDISVKTSAGGHFELRPAHPDSRLNQNIAAPTIFVCYGQSNKCTSTAAGCEGEIAKADLSHSPICHRQLLTNQDRGSEAGWFKSKAVLTPCYDYNVYMEVTSKITNSTIRSLPKAVKLGIYQISVLAYILILISEFFYPNPVNTNCNP